MQLPSLSASQLQFPVTCTVNRRIANEPQTLKEFHFRPVWSLIFSETAGKHFCSLYSHHTLWWLCMGSSAAKRWKKKALTTWMAGLTLPFISITFLLLALTSPGTWGVALFFLFFWGGAEWLHYIYRSLSLSRLVYCPPGPFSACMSTCSTG